MNLPKDTIICGAFKLQIDAGFEGTLWNKQYRGRYYEASHAGRFIAVYKDSFCEGTSDTMTISYSGQKAITYVPNAFSPNNDQINDSFPSAFVGVSDFNLRIFNRWGEQIFEGQNVFWPGTYKNGLIAQGIYLYIIEYRDCKEIWNLLKGTVTLVE